MDMKKKLIALAGIPVLYLFTSVALADVSGLPDESGNGIAPTFGEIKNRNDCDGATFFKNVFPSLTNGNPGGSDFIDLLVDGENVRVTVTWYAENYFDFAIDGASAKKVGVTVDTNNFIYDYTSSVVDGIADTEINIFRDESEPEVVIPGDDVNHLDLCLVTLDTEPPFVEITLPEDTTPPATVSGTVTVTATVTDNKGPLSVTACVYPVAASSCEDPLAQDLGSPSINGDEYTWEWDSLMVADGTYIISVSGTDSAEPTPLTETDTVAVEVVTSLDDCLEGGDGVPPGEPSEKGCNKTGFLQLEYPEELRDQYPDLNVTQAAIPAKDTVAPTASCRTDLFPLVVQDPRVDEDGNLQGPSYDLELGTLFDIAGHYAEFHPGVDVPDAILRADTVGSPCLTLIHQDAPDFADLTDVLPNGGVYTVTQFPEFVPGMFDFIDRITAPLSYCDVSEADCATLPICFDDPLVECYQPDPQFVEQAAYQPDDRFLVIKPFASPFTSDVFNASRTKGFKGSFFPLNTREVCLGLDPTLVPGTTAYLEAVYECKIDLALQYADDTRLAIEEADTLGNLIDPAVNTLYNWLNRAQGQIKNSHFERCIRYVQRLEGEILGGEWIVDDRNDPGRLIMYSRNLEWRCAQLLETEAYLDSLP